MILFVKVLYRMAFHIVFFISQTKSKNVEEYFKRRDEKYLVLVLHNAWRPRFVFYVMLCSCWRLEHSQRESNQRYTEKHVAVWLIYCIEACSLFPEERFNTFFLVIGKISCNIEILMTQLCLLRDRGSLDFLGVINVNTSKLIEGNPQLL